MKPDSHFFTQLGDYQTKYITFPYFEFQCCEPIGENIVYNKDRDREKDTKHGE